MKIISIIQDVYFNKKPFRSSDYEKGRKYFIYEGSTSMIIFALAGGAFISGFANSLGATDGFNGIIGAIPALTGVIQIFSALFFEKREHRKLLITLFAFLGRLLFGAIFLIPIFILNKEISLNMLLFIYTIAFLLLGFVGPPISGWLVDLTPENIRGKYLARKDAVSLAFVTVATLAFGKLLDIFRNNNHESRGFIVIGVGLFILAFCELFFLSSIKEPLVNKKDDSITLRKSILEPIMNKSFRKVVILFMVWNIALFIALPFFSVYMVTRLHLSYTYIMIMGLIGAIVRVLVVKYWGNLADTKSWEQATKYSIATLALCHFSWFFVNNQTAYILVPIMNVLGGIAWGGVSIALFNIQFLYAPKETRTIYIGGCAAYGGVIGFASTILGSKILDALSPYKISIRGFEFSNMQIIFLISGILLGLCSIYVHKFIEKKPEIYLP